jgi:ferredoxin-NADP reductase
MCKNTENITVKNMITALNKITPEAEEILGFTLKLSEPFSFVPGKYVMLSFADMPDEKRAFSVVEYDKEKNEIYLVIKKNGAFTQKLFNTKIGEQINIFGPYGKFVLPQEEKPLVFIAGGIGITPLFGMMDHISKNGYSKNLYLYYSGKSESKMALLDRINKIEDRRIKINFLFTEKSDRRVTVEEIKRQVPEFDSSLFYICGPVKMIEEFRNNLSALNIEEERIRSEEFN